MSYLSPQAEEIVSDNTRQPTDMVRDDWATSHGWNAPAQEMQGKPWLLRQPPRLRQSTKS